MLFCLGYGYVAQALSLPLLQEGWQLGGSSRDETKISTMKAAAIGHFDPQHIPAETTHLLVSAPPNEQGDMLLSSLPKLPNLEWVGYLSATSVYGDHAGEWVDESTPTAPSEPRGKARLKAEQQWRDYHPSCEIFRLSGIYGPKRSVIERIKAGKAQRIEKPGHVFNRIHVEDIAQCLLAAIKQPEAQSITNLADNLPASSADVTAYACTIMGRTPPPSIPYEDAQLSEMAQGFYASNKRIRNDRLRERLRAALASDLHYPTYKEGVRAILAACA